MTHTMHFSGWLAGLTLLFVIGGAQAVGHEQCQDCHAASPPSAANLKRPLSGLCINCHQARINAGEHAVDIPIKHRVTALPLQGGNMTCITCHDPHSKGSALRMADPQLCEVCH